MATALQQVKSANSGGASSLGITITTSLSGSVLWVWTAGLDTCTVPTDSASQTYVNLAAEVNNGGIFSRMDDKRNTVSGVTTVTLHQSSSNLLSGSVQELTGTNNTLDSTVPAIATETSTTPVTGAIITANGSILAVGVTNDTTVAIPTVSPAAYTVDSLTPANLPVSTAVAAAVASGSHTATFTLNTSATWNTGQAAYGMAAATQPPYNPWLQRAPLLAQ